MSRIEETLGGLWCLAMLALRGALSRKSAYWKWRDETAFGRDPARRPPLRKRWHAMLDKGIDGTLGVVSKPCGYESVGALVDFAVRARRGDLSQPPMGIKLFGTSAASFATA